MHASVDLSIVHLLLERVTQAFQLRNMGKEWLNFVATVQEECDDGKKQQRHLMPVDSPTPTPHFLEANVEQRLRMVFQYHTKKWYISEEEKGSSGSGEEKRKETILAFLDLGDKFPNNHHQWTNFGAPPHKKFSCGWMTLEQYTTTVLCVKMAEGAVQASETQLARQEYDLAAKNCFESFERLQNDTRKLQRDTAQFFECQQKQNESVDDRLRKLEGLIEENPKKIQRASCSCSKALRRVKKGEWVYSGDVVMLAHKGRVTEHTVQSWVQGFNYSLASNEDGEQVESHTRNMHWLPEKCEACRGAAA